MSADSRTAAREAVQEAQQERGLVSGWSPSADLLRRLERVPRQEQRGKRPARRL